MLISIRLQTAAGPIIRVLAPSDNPIGTLVTTDDHLAFRSTDIVIRVLIYDSRRSSFGALYFSHSNLGSLKSN